jgi:hypothetical protein
MAKPAVDGLERALAPQGVPVMRLSVTSGIGRQLAPSYGVRGVPTLILFDGEGQPRLTQVGRVLREPVLQAVAELLQAH